MKMAKNLNVKIADILSVMYCKKRYVKNKKNMKQHFENMQSDSPEFEYDTNNKLRCSKCHSHNISIVSKMFLTYYVCNDCGNEEQF